MKRLTEREVIMWNALWAISRNPGNRHFKSWARKTAHEAINAVCPDPKSDMPEMGEPGF